MEAFYEESAVSVNVEIEKRKYKLLHILSRIFLISGILFMVYFIWNMPFGNGGGNLTSEQQEMLGVQKLGVGFFGLLGVFFLGLWFLFFKMKRRYDVSFDYSFVSGELRISKVFNKTRRKLIERIDCADMIQVGDVDNSSYTRFKADPTVKEIICTPNLEAVEGKFFMYVLANTGERKMYILECREALLMNIMKFAKRGVLESDYVMQEKKQKK